MERMGHTVVPVSHDEMLLNDFATRCFFEVADADYIAARLAYGARLFMQFHWSSLQAVEKYLKAILLYNRVPATDVGHDLRSALVRCNQLPFNLVLSAEAEAFIAHLDTFADDRYLVFPYEISEPKLRSLDRTVWELRRYCRVLNWTGETAGGKQVNMLQAEIDLIAASDHKQPMRFKETKGLLETLLAKPRHPARKALVWRNEYFGSRHRAPLNWGWLIHSVNSPLTLNPHLLDTVLKYVFIPKKAVTAYRQYLQDVQSGKVTKP